jgi:hypothetical protein
MKLRDAYEQGKRVTLSVKDVEQLGNTDWMRIAFYGTGEEDQPSLNSLLPQPPHP